MTDVVIQKERLIEKIISLSLKGWHKSVKKTIDQRNDGAVGNTLEFLLGIKENNLPIPNSREWELKGQRAESRSLITLKHLEPSPRAAQIVSKILLPKYGWRHQQAGKKYPSNEKSFRSTTYANGYTNRGFRLIIDREQKKIRFVFDPQKADVANPQIREWLNIIKKGVGLGPLDPEPYWGFDDIMYAVGSKIKNCFYVIAESKVRNQSEFFRFREILILSEFQFDRLLEGFEKGDVYIDFDARTGHNHGTKFRIKQSAWPDLYRSVQKIILNNC